MNRGIFENLVILFLLLPLYGIAFWFFIRMLNKSTGVKIREVLELINTNPLAAAVYRGSIIIAVSQLVIAAFDRWV